MDTNNNIQKAKNVPPFVRYCSAIIPTMFDDSLSYYEALCALWKWLQDNLVNVINHNAAATEYYTQIVKDLKEYVENYFANLDVQEEINNKLDVMAEDGTLERLLQDAVNASYLYDEITVTEHFDEDTTTHYWITHIPHLDKHGNLIPIKHGLADDVNNSNLSCTETARDYAKRSGATICINASVAGNIPTDPNYKHPVGTLIKDGVLISNYGKDSDYQTSPLNILGVKADNTLQVYPFGTSYEALIADGVVNTFCAFDQVVTAGVITDEMSDLNYQWNLIGQNTTTKDIYLFECNGKDFYGEQGLTLPNACQKLVDEGCDFVYRLDQGGSTCLCENAVMLTTPTDDLGHTVRKTVDYLYFGKEPISEIDNSIKIANAQRSDASFLAMRNKARTTFLEDIENNTLVFNSPNKRHTLEASSGMHLDYKEEDVLRTSLVLDHSAHRKSLGIYDNENAQTVALLETQNPEIMVGTGTSQIDIKTQNNGNSDIKINNKSLVFNDHQIAIWDYATNQTKIRLDSDTKTIKLGDKETPDIFSTLTEQEATYSPDSVTRTSYYFIKYAANASPTNQAFNRPYYLLSFVRGGTEKLQVAFASTADTSIKPKFRLQNGGTWTAWITIG